MPFPAVLSRRGLWLLGALATALLVTGTWLVGEWSRESALAELEERGQRELELYVSHLNGQLDRFAYLPALLSGDERLKALLARPGDAELAGEVNRFLSYVNRIAGALDVYLMAADGMTLAASNWQQANTFVGHNFSFRPYFTEAIQGGPGRYFALGTTSQRRGYYFSYPVEQGGRPLGVVVVKLSIATLEQDWQNRRSVVLVTDPDGVIFVSSKPQWRYRTLGELSRAERERIVASRRYLKAGLEPLLLSQTGLLGSGARLMHVAGGSGGDYLVQSQAMPEAGWQVHLYADLSEVGEAVWQVRLLLLFVSGVALLALVVWAQRLWRRREQARHEQDKRRAMQQTLATLEERVAQRTVDLVASNRLLQEEVDRHQHTQDELIQAAKLAALGQMSAGISHELNQPLAAIRAYADSARSLLAHDRFDEAQDNLLQIAELTERMANISAQLRVFARRSEGQRTRVSLRASIDGALRILQPRIKAAGARIEVQLPDDDLYALADMVQLEQVLVNLLGNALDAVAGTPRPSVEVVAWQDGAGVVLTVRDHGAGIADEHLARIFDPFFTTSDTGLGLGLSISHRIVERMAGSLTAANHPDGGALFRLVLEPADDRPCTGTGTAHTLQP